MKAKKKWRKREGPEHVTRGPVFTDIGFTGVVFLFIALSSCETKQTPTFVPPPERFQACEQDVDCVKVSTTCDGCCQEDAVHKAFAGEYEVLRKKTCEGYHGGVCRCVPLEVTVHCIEKRCGLKRKTTSAAK